MNKTTFCKTCQGSGKVLGSGPAFGFGANLVDCEACGGTGDEPNSVPREGPASEDRSGLPFVITYDSPRVVCPECHGGRWKPSAAGLVECWFCAGRGEVSDLLAAQHDRLGV